MRRRLYSPQSLYNMRPTCGIKGIRVSMCICMHILYDFLLLNMHSIWIESLRIQWNIFNYSVPHIEWAELSWECYWVNMCRAFGICMQHLRQNEKICENFLNRISARRYFCDITTGYCNSPTNAGRKRKK